MQINIFQTAYDFTPKPLEGLSCGAEPKRHPQEPELSVRRGQRRCYYVALL